MLALLWRIGQEAERARLALENAREPRAIETAKDAVKTITLKRLELGRYIMAAKMKQSVRGMRERR